MTTSYRAEVFSASNSKSKITLDVTYKITNTVKSIYKWSLKLDDKKLLSSKTSY